MSLNSHHTGIRKLVILTLVPFLFMQAVNSQDKSATDTFDIAGNILRFPVNPKPWLFKIGVGFLMAQPPKDLVETSLQAPMAHINMTCGLPWNFSLAGDITTILVSNQLSLGIRIGSGFRNFAINGGLDFAWTYGQYRPDGFDNVTKAWLLYPTISLGYKLKKMAFTLKAEIVYISSIQQLIGKTAATGMVMSSYTNYLNGYTWAFYIEQRLWKNNVLVIGLKDNYLKYYWPTWMLFSTFDRLYHIPEFSLMLIL